MPDQAQPAYDENTGYTNQYNTPLSAEQEAAFQAWGQQQAAIRSDHRNPAEDTYDYDMRGFWLSGAQFAANGHGGDTFKKPNHPTFSTFSKYATPETPGGTWNNLPDGSWTFAPSPTNLKFHDPGDLQQYFQTTEPGNKLILPQPPTMQENTQPAAGAIKSMSALPSSPPDYNNLRGAVMAAPLPTRPQQLLTGATQGGNPRPFWSDLTINQ